MNKEEKELLNKLKLEIKTLKCNENIIDTHILINIEDTKILLNYIDKLQKENEEFQKANKMLNDFIISNQIECINKDKIRDKIKEVAEEVQIYVDTEKFEKEFEKSIYIIKALKELLEGDKNE